jgi:diguanylate cyclase (GGDEF)-like protein
MRVLIADDDELTRELLRRQVLQWGFEPVVATDGEQAWASLLAADAPQIAILDWIMPGCSGLELCAWLRRETRDAYTYVILLTARGHEEDVVEGLLAGADDFVGKPCSPRELEARLRAARRIIALESRLRERATYDALTGLLNRRAVLEHLEMELARARRIPEARVGAVLVDVDHFKAINDHHGHLVGDQVLAGVGRRLQAVVRAGDWVGRYGGEEFLVVASAVATDDLSVLGERVREAIASRPFDTDGGPLEVTISVGISAGRGTEDARHVLGAADGALYRSKAAGRNRVVLASPSLLPSASHARLVRVVM